MNETGDVTITWDKDNEAYVKALVEKRMNEGHTFFITIPRKIFGKEFSKVKTKLKSIKQLDKVNSVTLEDNEGCDPGEIILPSVKKRTVGVNQKGLDIAFDTKDDELNLALKDDKIKLVKLNQKDSISTRRALTAGDVIKNQSVAVRKIVGG